jgi:hypothetical protein
MIAGALCAFYDPLKRTGEDPVAREQRNLAAILGTYSRAYDLHRDIFSAFYTSRQGEYVTWYGWLEVALSWCH